MVVPHGAPIFHLARQTCPGELSLLPSPDTVLAEQETCILRSENSSVRKSNHLIGPGLGISDHRQLFDPFREVEIGGGGRTDSSERMRPRLRRVGAIGGATEWVNG